MDAAIRLHLPDPGRRGLALGLVLLLHLVLAYLLLNGSSQRVIDAVSVPVTVRIVQAINIATEPAPPQASDGTPKSRRWAAPSRLPGAERRGLTEPSLLPGKAEAPVAPSQPTSPAVAQGHTTASQPAAPAETDAPTKESRTAPSQAAGPSRIEAPVAMAPIPAQAPTALARLQPNPAAPGPTPGARADTPMDITDLCPTRLAAQPPARAMRAELGGRVLARARIKGGQVLHVEILASEPAGLFDGAVRSAMLNYRCRDLGEREILAEQTFEFKPAP